MTPLCMLGRRRVVHTRAQSFSWFNVANGLQSRACRAIGPEEITLLDADAFLGKCGVILAMTSWDGPSEKVVAVVMPAAGVAVWV